MSRRDSRAGVWEWLARRLLPRWFVSGWGKEVMDLIAADRAEARRRGRRAVLWFHAATALDLLRAAWETRRGLVDGLISDVRRALRGLRVRDGGFSATAVLTLAACMAANTAVLGVVRSVLLKPLPVPDAAELVLLYDSFPRAGAARIGNSVPDYLDRTRLVPALAETALFRRERLSYRGSQGYQRRMSVRATPSFFRLARLRPAAGRLFGDDESESGTLLGVVISHGFWRGELGADPQALGRTLELGGSAATIIGIAPEDFRFVWDDVDFYLLASFTPVDRSDARRHSHSWQMVGRLAAGAGIEQVQQQVDALNLVNRARFPELEQVFKDTGFHTIVVPLHGDLVRDVRRVLYLLWGGVGFVLLIGCANLINLILVRANARRRELATRRALGASLGRLAVEILTETTTLAVTGGALGLLSGWLILRWAATIDWPQLPRASEIAMDVPVATAILGLALAAACVLALAPILRLRGAGLHGELGEGPPSGSGGRSEYRIRQALAASQIAIAFVLLIGAGLLLASFRAVLDLELGFEPANVWMADVSLPRPAYGETARRIDAEQRLLQAVRAMPNVEAAGVTTHVPFTGPTAQNVIVPEGWDPAPDEALIVPAYAIVGTGYFEAMGVRLLEGRFFRPSDTLSSQPVVIIDRRLARRFFGDARGVGRRLYFPDLSDVSAVTEDTRFFTVVGVVEDVRLGDPQDDADRLGSYYMPFAQRAPTAMTLVLRTSAPSSGLPAAIRQAVASVDPNLPVYRARALTDVVEGALAGRRLPMLAASAFGLTGALLAAFGIYGVLTYGVAQRRRELGIRMALGASASAVFGLVLREGVFIAVPGLTAGLAGAYFTGRLVRSQLFGVTPMDPAVVASVAASLAFLALLASVLPSRRASRTRVVAALTGRPETS